MLVERSNLERERARRFRPAQLNLGWTIDLDELATDLPATW